VGSDVTYPLCVYRLLLLGITVLWQQRRLKQALVSPVA
jgi:hypothetical protein